MIHRIILIVTWFFLVNHEFLIGQDKTYQKKITIGMIGKMTINPVFIAAYSGARVAAKELGAKYRAEIIIDWQCPEKENVQEQATAIRRFSNQGVDGIAISCTDANFLSPVIDEVVEKGIPVMCYDSDAPKSKRFAYYGADDIEFGRMIIKELSNVLKGTGTIAVLAGNRNALNLQRRLQGIKEELKKYPKINLSLDNIHHNIDIPDIASATIARVQNANPEINGWALVTSSALLIKNSFSWNPGEVKVVAGNAVPAELEYVKSGYVQSLVGVNCFQYGYKSIEILLEKIVNKRAPKETSMYIQLVPVNKENVDEWSLNWKKWLIKEAVTR
jgi:ribose transport system substrate-binding protein